MAQTGLHQGDGIIALGERPPNREASAAPSKPYTSDRESPSLVDFSWCRRSWLYVFMYTGTGEGRALA
jgi:hypothetical protein